MFLVLSDQFVLSDVQLRVSYNLRPYNACSLYLGVAISIGRSVSCLRFD